MTLLRVENLCINFETRRGNLRAVDRVSFEVGEGQTLGIVGESGCGKSITSLAVLGLLPPTATITADTLEFDGKDLLSISESAYADLRGGDLAMIFQDPMTSLNPCFSVGSQIEEALRIHQKKSSKGFEREVIELLDKVGIPDPESRLSSYPHQLSGGMCQRVMIAMAIACRPKLLIADEPTTALDVTIQAQILNLLRDLQSEYGMAMIMITHDIGVVSEVAEQTMVMYAGQVVESGPTQTIINSPSHPYSEGLLDCLPGTHEQESKTRLPSIPGMVPDLVNRPKGCQLHPRCKYVMDSCRTEVPDLEEVMPKKVRCVKPLNQEVRS